MTTQIVVPALGESVTEATIAKWFKQVGDAVAADEPLVELETDKVTVEVNAPSAGTLSEIAAAVGVTVEVGALLGAIDASGAPAKVAAPAPAAATPAATPAAVKGDHPPAPSAQKMIAENKLDAASIAGSGKDGRITKGDVISALERPVPAAPAPTPVPTVRAEDPREERVKMTRLRKRIAERLKAAQNTAAMLTTFNEVDMTALLALRNQYKEGFEKKHGVKLGFMSFFVKACVTALKEWPAVNGEIDGDDVVYKNYYDIGVAVGTPNGLVVPVVRDADKLSFAGVEKTIGGYGKKARDGKLTIEEMTGGTFTISNGGVYGSLMSTPILNPPQSAILGMHKTQLRPMVMPDGRIEARPMMYLAVSYDHRIIDGREAVSFLVRVKECIEDPQRILLDM
ncbi:2-oxoglutarate dehydrogenase complex dihydrolipoyllysine-residue succinyltransferase [Telmatospirillum siberiense]|uniref:Dihydrolipoyllysine-residue succinyltransferase component of 2-oxoglutarate dehydrogenase complex n=1 Tax=Telmatospirillum siberiense TaxID=382514 RepID=A0A2N3PY63_9PROT|nr:2-oxoglutarate dehydrogenase complex dihydrolipoyllysine-residue succinyltransferase [Telmatospirillum siberiense]PKU25347.1 dihydrolipoyllysine-residue succinyltransferase [Telmatospirillum siberiense]